MLVNTEKSSANRTLENHLMCLQEMTAFIIQWRPYSVLWKNEKSARELQQIKLTEFEDLLEKHHELKNKLDTEKEIQIIGNCLAISTEKLKYGLLTEIRSCTHK